MIRLALPSLVSLVALLVGIDDKEKSTPDQHLVLRNARIHTAAGPVIEDGTLIVHKGKIIEVGPSTEVKVPKDAEVHDLKGKVIIPGLVDTHSHVGIWSKPFVPANSDGNEGSGPVQP